MTPVPDDRQQFAEDREREIAAMDEGTALARLSREWVEACAPHRYTYHFEWLGLPVIQYPQDLVAMQEIIWRTRPEVIVETGVARGGSMVFYASLLALLGGEREVIGIDHEIRPHNREAILGHPLASHIRLVDGDSTAAGTVAEVHRLVRGRPALVALDSNHTHAHVLAELRAYADLVAVGGYLVVFDTVIDRLPEGQFPDRPWGPGNNPATAVAEFLAEDGRFVPDLAIDRKLQISVAPGGYLRRIR